MVENVTDINSTLSMWLYARSGEGTATYTDDDGFVTVIDSTDAFLEFTKTLGEFSIVFKSCYEGTDTSIYHFWMFIRHYESFKNYMLNLTANVLSYALFFNSWSERIQKLDNEPGNELELLFVYTVILRKLFLFEYFPDALNDDMDPIEFKDAEWNNLSVRQPKHLKAVLSEADAETQVFLEQYLSYSKLLGEASWLALEELT